MQTTINVAPHYTVKPFSADHQQARKEFLAMFGTGQVDSLNFVLFSTSGVHGTYLTIEDVEKEIAEGGPAATLTVLVIRPRLVAMVYGEIAVLAEDIPLLKKIRSASWAIVNEIGADDA